MELFWIILCFVIGAILIVKGGDLFVDAATWIAEVSKIPKFIIGATIVSLATTLPEIIVSSFAAVSGKVDMAIGNAVGSVTANTGLILSIGILFMPVVIKRKGFMFKGLLLLGTIGALLVLSLPGELTIWASLVLFALFGFFIFENLRSAKESDPELPDVTVSKKTVTLHVLKFVLGAAGIVIGSQLLVDNGSSLARMAGIPENVIGLTAIAIGTSLPELVTTITAISKKESALSVGNILGANIIDTALILPICAILSGGAIPVASQVLALDLPVCLLIAAVAIVPTIIRKKFSRWQGIAGLVLYGAYLAYICL